MTNDTFRDALRAPELLLVPEVLMLREGPVYDYAVLINGATFADVGPAADVIKRHPNKTPVSLEGRALMAGFVDTHHHLTQSFGKSLAYGEPSEIFRRVWVPLESSLDDEFLYLVTKLAALEALRGGFTTVCDAGTRAKGDITAIARAVQDVGLRCVLGYICNDGSNDSTVDQRRDILAGAEAFIGRWQNDGLVHPSLAIAIPEAASDEMLRKTTAMCRETGVLFQTHCNEHVASLERSVVNRGMRPLELLHHLGALGPQVLIAHGTLVTPTELTMLADTGTAVAYCPVASQWKGNAVAPATLMSALGIRFGLGTDSTRPDGFRLMDAAEAAQKLAFAIAVADASSGGGWLWFDHATAEGAQAAGLEGVTGEIAVGKRADFLLIDIDTPEMCTSFDLTWDLVRLGNRDQIEAVFVAGAMRLWHGWPLDWDARALMKEVSRKAAAAVSNAPIKRLHLPAAQERMRARTTRIGM